MNFRLFDPNFLNLEYFFNRIYRLLSQPFGLERDFSSFFDFLTRLWWFMLILSFALLALVSYLILKIKRIREEEELEMVNVFEEAMGAKEVRNERWESLLKYLESENPSEWKLALIEADTLLDEMVGKLGYQGDNLGERLKVIEPSDFLTLQDAWEAHKVRNRIAHEASFQLSKREARRVIGLFEKVFREFHFI